MPRPGSGRSEAVRIRLSDDAWGYFQELQAQVRREHPEAQVEDGDVGTRKVLATWIEGRIREETDDIRRDG